MDIPFEGIQHNVVLPSQCQVCMNVSYETGTTSADIESCKSKGGFIVVGASKHPEYLNMAAGLHASDLKMSDDNQGYTYTINGVTWFWVPYSFGFSNKLDFIYSENDLDGSGDCAGRLSWFLGGGYGWLAGCETGYFGSNTPWRKVMYTCKVQGVSDAFLHDML